VFEYVIHDRISRYFKSTLNSFRHDLQNLRQVLVTIISTTCSQGQRDSNYFDLRSGSDLFCSPCLRTSLAVTACPVVMLVNWFCSYLSNRLCCFRFSGIFSSPFAALSWWTSRLFWDLCCLTCTLTMHTLTRNFLLCATDIKIFLVVPRLMMTACFALRVCIYAKLHSKSYEA
jgi:hypothetical protein